MNLIDTLNQIWTQILEVTAIFVMPGLGRPDRPAAGARRLGLVGPFLTFTAPRVADLPGPQAARQGRVRGGAARRRDRRRRRARSSRSGCPTAAATRSSTRRARSAASTATTSSRSICPMCGLGRAARRRHLLELRPRPQGQAARRRRPHDAPVRSPAAPRPPEALTMAAPLVEPLLARRHPRRARVRGPRRPRGDAGQRPAAAARPRAAPASRPTPAS